MPQPYRAWAQRLAALCCACMAAACASLAPRDTASTSNPSALSARDEPVFIGRLSVLTPNRDGQRLQGSQASFELRGTAERGLLELSTPMGNLVARARWQPDLVSIQTPEGERAFDTLDAMTRELLGESVPMAALLSWLQSRPWPDAEHQPLSPPMVGFTQLGWHIDMSRSGEGLIVAKRLQPPEVTLRVRLDRTE